MSGLAVPSYCRYGDEFDLYEQAKFDGQKAREMLVTRNMGLVYHCFNQIIGKNYGTTSGSTSSIRQNAKRTCNTRTVQEVTSPLSVDGGPCSGGCDRVSPCGRQVEPSHRRGRVDHGQQVQYVRVLLGPGCDPPMHRRT